VVVSFIDRGNRHTRSKSATYACHW